MGVGVISGADLDNHSIFFNQTWLMYQLGPEMVPFAILRFLEIFGGVSMETNWT